MAASRRSGRPRSVSGTAVARCAGLVVALAVVGGATPARAQIVNVLSSISLMPKGFGANLSLSATWKTGNTELLSLAGGMTLGYQWTRDLLYVVAKADYGMDGHRKVFVNNTFEHLRYRHAFFRWLAGEVFVQHESDPFRRLRLRELAGIGPRFSVQPFTVLSLHLGTDYMFEYDAYKARDGSPASADSEHRLSLYGQISFAYDRVSLDATAFAQPRIDRFNDTRLMSEAGLVVQGTRWLAVKVTFRVDYDSHPPPNVKTTDTSLETDLSFTFPPPKPHSHQRPPPPPTTIVL